MKDVLDTLTNLNEMSKLVNRKALVAISPLVVDQDYVVESETLLRQV
jgi:hypothetical protein